MLVVLDFFNGTEAWLIDLGTVYTGTVKPHDSFYGIILSGVENKKRIFMIYVRTFAI